VNRLSLGIQSFNDRHLKALGRIHGSEEARRAIAAASAAGFHNFNLDLMYALPDQSIADARADLEQAIALRPTHLSYYQLTLEPNTLFYRQPPPLPDDESSWEMHLQGEGLLSAAGFAQYEISAFARPERRCAHNRNYWEFGDYLGIGAGAHGKLTDRDGRVWRSVKQRHPREYLRTAGSAGRLLTRGAVPTEDLPLEFLMNGLRLNDGVDLTRFTSRTGLAPEVLQPALQQAIERGLLLRRGDRLGATALGRRHLDTVLTLFLPACAAA
jgi:putative oxygen-independent coproporphyrinogen III oxidase